MFKGNYFDGYKSPLNSVFVIILYLINSPLFVLKHTKKLYSLLKKNFNENVVIILLQKHSTIWMNRYFLKCAN
jgi:hypothetical protein